MWIHIEVGIMMRFYFNANISHCFIYYCFTDVYDIKNENYISLGEFNVKTLHTPITEEEIKSLRVGDMVYISGKIYCGRDAVLPKICELIDEDNLGDIKLQGSVIFHTAVSPAGVGPTSSNKMEIEGSIPKLSAAGVRLHLGKGTVGADTIAKLDE